MDSRNEEAHILPARLCKNCQVLKLDDHSNGGSELTLDGDKSYPEMHALEWKSHWYLPLDYNLHDFLPSLPILHQYAHTGCDFCRFLRDTILSKDTFRNKRVQDVFAQTDTRRVDINMAYMWTAPEQASSGMGMLSLEVILILDNQGEEWDWVVFIFTVDCLGDDDLLSKWLRAPKSQGFKNRLHPECVAWAKSKIDRCIADHCHASIADRFCPERLIDVQSEPVRLVLTENVNPIHVVGCTSPIYTALSYCWGSQIESRDQLTTTGDSLLERFSGISDYQMTPVLRDAVLVTRSLSISYLWIDALCIVQDSRTDWERQSPLMGKIYGNAYVTIGATGSTSCNDQFSFSKHAELFISYHSAINLEAEGILRFRHLTLKRKLSQVELNTSSILSENLDNCQWGSRGWTYQEFVMSTRFLGFGRSELCFSCPFGAEYMGGGATTLFMIHLCSKHWSQRNVAIDYGYWDEIIMDYSSRYGYTHSTDILPALSGVADFFSKALKVREGDYMAGLWKGNLFASVAWSIQDLKRTHLTHCLTSLADSEPYISPSWSWVNRGAVEFMSSCYSKFRQECQIEAWTSVEGTNPYGHTVDGLLRITGKVSSLPSDMEKSKTNFSPHLRPWIPTTRVGHCWYYHLDWAPLKDTEPRGKLKMGLTGSAIKNNSTRRSFFGLLIHEAGPSNPGKFYRVGMFESKRGVRQARGSGTKIFDCDIQSVDII